MLIRLVTEAGAAAGATQCTAHPASWTPCASGLPLLLSCSCDLGARQSADALRAGRQRVLDNLKRGRFRRHAVELPPGLENFDLRQHAAMEGTHIVIRDLKSSATLHRWRLPPLPGLDRDPYGWRWGGGTLSIAFRGGVLLVNTGTGDCKPVQLAAEADSKPSQSDWSSTGNLLLRYSGAAGAHTASMVDAGGQLLKSSTAFPGSLYFHAYCWSPSGHAAAIGGGAGYRSGASFSLWSSDRVSPPAQHQLSDHMIIDRIDWCFDSEKLLITASEHCIIIWDVQRQREQERLWLPGCQALAWGSRNCLAAFCRQNADEPFELQAYELQQSSGRFKHVNTVPSEAPEYVSMPVRGLHPSGAAVCLGSPDSADRHSISVVNLSGLVLRNLPMPFCPFDMRWTADGTRLLASDLSGCRYQLLEFA